MLLLPKVIRIVFQLVGLAGNYRTIGEFGADFLKKLSFSGISIHFSDFIHLRVVNVDLHAQGFAPL